MGMNMALSREMTHYITTGRCTYCNRAILSEQYVRSNAAELRQNAEKVGDKLDIFGFLTRLTLAPTGVKTRVNTPSGSMTCLWCFKTWMPSALLVNPTSLLKPIPNTPTVQLRPVQISAIISPCVPAYAASRFVRMSRRKRHG